MINLIAVDVYDDSPTIVTIWLTIMPKISILILFLELYIGEQNIMNYIEVKNVLLICSLLSLNLGTLVGLAQNRIKRLLAYSI
jgi:NADH-ubiquinone oxidoreductase chain 2